MSPEPASHDPEEFVDGSQPWPRLLAFKNGELLAKGEVFEHQTAARPQPAKHGSEPEPKQVKHGNKVIADPLAGCPAKLLISKPDRIVTRHRQQRQQYRDQDGCSQRELPRKQRPFYCSSSAVTVTLPLETVSLRSHVL